MDAVGMCIKPRPALDESFTAGSKRRVISILAEADHSIMKAQKIAADSEQVAQLG